MLKMAFLIKLGWPNNQVPLAVATKSPYYGGIILPGTTTRLIIADDDVMTDAVMSHCAEPAKRSPDS
jgi:hypothetical protein